MRKKVRNMYLTLSSLLLSYLLFFPVNVYASGTSDAVADIMNSDRFAGAISSIEWLTTRVDYWFTMVITAAGFFIISAALLKNACAGAYCANHKFWDKVAEAHEKSESMQLSQLFGGGMKDKVMNLSTSGIKDALLCIVPNIKAFTDFDDADIEPKQYFMKAIPQMLGCIIIGVFIYNGYYRDTAASVGNFGSEICSRVFSSVDPATWVDKITQTTSTPANIYDNDQTLEGKALCKISKELYKVYLSNSKNITSKEDKTNLMRDSEAMASDILKANASSTDGDASAIEARFFSDESRIYDFSIGNLKIVPCPATSAQNTGTLTCTTLDNDTLSEYSLTGYFLFNSGATSNTQVPTNCAAFHITFTMKGSQKTNITGLTSISASAGSWSNNFAETVSVTFASNEYKYVQHSSGNMVECDNFKTKIAGKQEIKDAATKIVGETIKKQGGTPPANYTYPEITVSKYPGQGEKFATKVGVSSGYTYSGLIVRVVVAYTDAEKGECKVPVKVPVNVTFP